VPGAAPVRAALPWHDGDPEEGVSSVSNERNEISISLSDLVRFVLRGMVPAIIVAGAIGAAVYFWTARQPPVFQADSTVLVARGGGGAAQFGLTSVTAPPIDLRAYQIAAVSDQVLESAVELLGSESPTVTEIRSLRSRVSASSEVGVRDSSLLFFAGRGSTPAQAIARSNAVANAIVAWDERRSSESLIRVVASLEQQIEALSEQVRTLQATAGAGGADQIEGLLRLRAEQQQQVAYARALVASAQGLLTVLQRADSTVRQIAPRPAMSAAVAALLAVVLVYGVMLLRSAFNTKLRSPDHIAEVAGLPILVEFPSTGRKGDPALREASSYLRANLLFNTEDVHPRVFMVTSALEGEGKTTTATALAESFARYGYRTLLIDADLRSPSVVERFDVVGNVGRTSTTESWLHDLTIEHQLLSISLGTDGELYVIPQLKAVTNAPELLGRRFQAALQTLVDFDVIVIDTPPLLAVADAMTIAPHCTSTLLVVDQQRTDSRQLTAAVNALQQIGVPVAGIVANRVSGGGSGGGSYGTAYGERPARPPRATLPAGAASRAVARPNKATGRT